MSTRPPKVPADLKACFRPFYTLIHAEDRYVTQTVYEQYALARRDASKVNIAIRHDVDIAFDRVLPLAEYEHGLGVRASYYFLTDTAPYDLWHSDVPRRLIALGHEVGLHSDHRYEELALGRDGLARLREDVERLSELCGERIHGVVWHGGKHLRPLGAHNYDLYETLEASDLGLEYHDAVLYQEGTRKWCCKQLLTDGENNLRFVPGKMKHQLEAASAGDDVLFVGHPVMMFRGGAKVALEYPTFPHLSPPVPRTLALDLKSLLAYNKAYLGERKVRWIRRLLSVVERLS